jgi:flagellar protein FlaI
MRLRIPKIKEKKIAPVGGMAGALMIVQAMKRGCAKKKSRQGAAGIQPKPPGTGQNIIEHRHFHIYSEGGGMGAGPTGGMGGGEHDGFRGGMEGGTLKGVLTLEKPKEEETGVSIPTSLEPHEEFTSISESAIAASKELRGINIYYPLIPANPRKGDRIFAYCNIKWDPRNSEIIYNVIEPFISKRDEQIIEKTKELLEEKLDIDFAKLGKIKGAELLRSESAKILSMVTDITEKRKEALLYYIQRDIIGLGKLEPIMQDGEIEDVSCDGHNIPIYIYHRDSRFGTLHTNVAFANEELDNFVVKMAQRCGKMLSIAEPLLDASLPDGSRVQITLGTDIARRGSNFTVRKFTEKPLTPTHMMEYKTVDSMCMAYLWLAIEHGKSMLVSGGTATGKTSMLNALSLFINQNTKVVSIEDTPELKLPHPHWVPQVARTALTEGTDRSEVNMFDLLKSSLRQRPDRLVVGEVRGKEAFVMFQQIATGHPSLATIHASSLPQLIDRLITPPISLPPTLIENVDILIFLLQVKYSGRYVRRANEIVEITGIKDGAPVTRQVFKWSPVKDVFKAMQKSRVLEDIAQRNGMTEDGIKSELLRRKKILDWMHFKRIFDYVEVSMIINTYYNNPESVLAMVEEK